jgi:pyruvate/2-oxoglutarate dehydrogenase complex dihydrolipoamide acyltransferase (E2) component
MTNIILPELGEGVTKATVACWHAKIGQTVKAGDEVCEVVTDKATFSVDAPVSGRLQSITVPEGKDGHVGGVLGVIE